MASFIARYCAVVRGIAYYYFEMLTCLDAKRAEVCSEDARVAAFVPARVDQPPLPRPGVILSVVALYNDLI